MINYKKIIHMHENDFSIRAIAQSLRCHRNTITKCINKVEELGISLDDYSNEEVKQLLFPQSNSRNTDYALPDFEYITEQMQKPNMSLVLLWHRYVTNSQELGKKFYQQTQFYELYRRHRQQHNITIPIDRQPGESLEIDWAGDALFLQDSVTGLRNKVHLFVAAFSYSKYFYTEACIDQKVHSWIQAHDHALQFFGGVPLMLIPDNAKTAVIKPDRYEPTIHEAYQEFAEHYGTVVIPARVRKPKDKPNVEGAVNYITRRIIADLQDGIFFSIDDLNQSVWERMDALNAAPFTKKPGTRESVFLEVEKQALLPLPPTPFTLYERNTATVAPDIHVQFDKSYYSVPYNYIGNNVIVKATADLVTIEHPAHGKIAEHTRSYHPGKKVTLPEHLPAHALEYSSWNGDTFRRQARAIGPNTLSIIEETLNSREFEVQSYRSCVGILSLKKKYGPVLLEQACQKGVELGIRSSKGIRSYIKVLEQEAREHPPAPVAEVEDDLNLFYCTHTQKEVPHDLQ